MTVFKRNVHLGTKDPLIETDDIADKAVTTEKIDDKAVAMPKIGDDVKQYIATQVDTETTGREGEIERLEGLIDLERSDRDTEEGAIWADVRKKANIVDISDYMSENARLPLNGAYNYEGIPVTAVPANIDTASVIGGVSPGDSDIETFILFRVEADVSYKPAHLFYVCFWEDGRYANRWFANDAPEDVKRVFNDNIVASDVAGLMSATDKNNLDTAVSDLSVVKGKIAPAASSTNQLADKDFVNSSIATNTATFRGTVDSVSALDNIVGADENDYAFVTRTDASGNLWYDRYKRTGNSWLFEYTLNNSSFTAEQWAAINSGLNSNDRGNVDTAVRNASTAVGTANTALGQSDTALLRSGEAVEIARNDAHIVANLEGAFSGTSPILDFSTDTEYGTGANQVNYCYKDGLLYKATTTHTGEWNASHFEEMNVLETMRLFSQVMLGLDEIPLFSTASSYSKDDYTIYEDKLYRFIENHSAGAWNANQVAETNVFNELIRLGEVANEKITVILSTEDGLGTVSGVSVSFTVEGESEPREIFTDAEGKASTIVTKGLLVDIDVAGIQGYETPDEVHVRASLPMRNVYVTYIVDRSAMYEHVRLTFSYADANNVNVATSIGVYYKDNDSDANPTLHTINVVNNVAEFDVPRGKEYTIVFPDVDVYRTPATISWTADHVSRQHTVLYVENNNGLSWVLNDGTEVPVNAVTQEDYDNIAGMLVYVSSCRPFIIPRDTPVAQRNWLSSNVGISTMGEFGSHSVALGDTDGEANCQKIADFCSGTSYTSGMVTYARTIQVEINGVPKVGFVAAYAQLWAMKTLYSQIRSYFAVVGLAFPNITSGLWWSSTQCNAATGVCLNNGIFGSDLKNHSNITVLPVLAYD